MKRFVALLLLIWIFLGSGIVWLFVKGREPKWLTPLADKILPKIEGNDFEVIGFLPPWTIDKATLYPNVLDQLIFLGIEVTEEGKLVWDSQSNKIYGQRYQAMKGEMWAAGKKNVVGIKLFDDKKIAELMASAEAKQNLITEINELVKNQKFDGINVDFEYQGDAQAVLEDEFVAFLGDLRKMTGKPISIDVFANTIIKGDSTALAKMITTIDHTIVMAYDFHQPGSNYAGPVAPIQSEVGSRNIMEVVNRVVTLGLDKSKILLAYPLYGYEWRTMSDSFGAETKPGLGQTATYKRVQDLLKDTSIEKKLSWDEVSMTPWLSFVESETAYKRVKVGKKYKSVPYQIEVVHEIYYDDLRSLGVKYDLVKSSQMGGLGFWALGYEGDASEVWTEMKKRLSI